MQQALTRWLLAFGFGLVTMLGASTARADERCGARGRTWIAVHADATVGDDVGARVVRELRAGFANQSIDVCDTEGESAPAARVSIVLASGASSVAIRLLLSDAVTAKDVSRTLDVAGIPPDGRALAIALATEELLRASWAEIALANARLPPLPIPEPVTRVVEASIVRPSSPPPAKPAPERGTHVAVGLGIDFAAEIFSTGFTRFGADARVSVEIGPRLTLGARAGFRRSPVTTAPDGTVDADALIGGVDASIALLPREQRFGLDAFVRADLARITFHAIPIGGAVAASATLTSIEASGGARASLSLTRSLRAFVELGLGGPLVAARARDGTTTVAGTDGLLFGTSAGIVGIFR